MEAEIRWEAGVSYHPLGWVERHTIYIGTITYSGCDYRKGEWSCTLPVWEDTGYGELYLGAPPAISAGPRAYVDDSDAAEILVATTSSRWDIRLCICHEGHCVAYPSGSWSPVGWYDSLGEALQELIPAVSMLAYTQANAA